MNNPGLVKHLTLIEPPAFWVLKEHNRLSEDAKKTMDLLSSFKNEISEKDLETFLTSVGFAKPGTSVRDDPKWNNWVRYRYSLRQNSVVTTHTDKISRLKNFNAQVLLVKGTGSASFLHDAIDLMAKDFPQAQVIELPAGHAPHIVSMDKFLERVKNFHNQ